jgi:hypothetical protein
MPLRCAQENVEITFTVMMYKQPNFRSCACIINYIILSSAQPHALAVLPTYKRRLVVFDKSDL